MIKIKTKLRMWGNSFRIVIPQRAIQQERIEEGDNIVVLMTKEKPSLRKLFGTMKFKKSVEQMMRETDKELYNE